MFNDALYIFPRTEGKKKAKAPETIDNTTENKLY